ncbi:MAG: hypothetical protein AB7P02_05250 [Alphaproteobacteria bacterium]
MAKARYAACMSCRGAAQAVAGITEAQRAALNLGRPKGTNRRTGYRHRSESKQRTSAANKAFWAAHPALAIERGRRGPAHYNWNGGSSRLNDAIRRMTENRKWMDAVKARDGACVRCRSDQRLESHHKDGLAKLIERLDIRSRDDARQHAATLWSLDNGVTLCRPCHYQEHGRRYAD